MKQTILLTGASGLLGSEIAICLQTAGYEVLKVRKTPSPGFLSLDIADETQVARFAEMSFDYIVHTAANKDPDSCEKNPQQAYQINVAGTAALAKIAGDKNIPMLFISTDYVFDGTRPPYHETDAVNPLNVYGQTKCDGETALFQACPKGCVLRVPFLFGGRAGLVKSTVIAGATAAANSPEIMLVEDELIRCPTATYDVANAVKAAIAHDLRGIYHFSGRQSMTRYQVFVEIAKMLKLSPDAIQPRSLGEVIARRPHNANLSMDKWLAADLPGPEEFPVALARALQALDLLGQSF